VLVMTLGEGISAVSAVLAFWIMVRFVDKQPWATAGFNRSGMAAARSAPEAGVVFLVVFLAVGTLTGVLLLRAAVKRGQWVSRPRQTA